MLGKEKLKQIAEKVLSLSQADQTEVLLSVGGHMLTRFANNEIHQNMAWQDIGISVRVIVQKRIGVASTNSFEPDALQRVVKKAMELAHLQEPDPDFVSLPNPSPGTDISEPCVFATEAELANGVSTIIRKAQKAGLIGSGAYANEVSELAVANSLGLFSYHQGASCNLSTIVLGKTSSGFAADVGKTARDINAEKIGTIAVTKTLESKDPEGGEPGAYDVILEPQAVSELMAFFQFYGPNARLYHEQASCLSGKISEQVFGENITIIDDPFHELVFPMPFDYEGFPKKKLTIIENGVLKHICYDSYHAHRFGAENTGHALPAPNTMGPIPLHLYVAPGDKTKEEMIGSIKKGILVTRLWYVRVLNPKALNITGMTRDGTFLIENGKVTKPLKNMRFNQSIPEALHNVVSLENKLTQLASFEGELIGLAPTMHIKNWHFSSATLF